MCMTVHILFVIALHLMRRERNKVDSDNSLAKQEEGKSGLGWLPYPGHSCGVSLLATGGESVPGEE